MSDDSPIRTVMICPDNRNRMILTATHRTRYRYPSPAVESKNEVRLAPLQDAYQALLNFRLDVRPDSKVFEYDEPGGRVHHFSIRNPHLELVIEATATVDTLVANPFADLDLMAADMGFYELDDTRQSFAEFLSASPFVHTGATALEFLKAVRPQHGENAARNLIALCHALFGALEYESGTTDVHTHVEDVFAGRQGVCQDFAHVFISCARTLGIPTRYVSGYLFGGDVALRGELATHAWVESLMPDGRWLAFDPTNDMLANDHYIRVHVGRDYSDITPVRGVYLGPPADELDVAVTVVRTNSRV